MYRFTTTLLSVLALAFAVGCGGETESITYAETPPVEDIRGSYQIDWFEVGFFASADCDENTFAGALTPNDFNAWSGTMTLGDTDFSQRISAGGGEPLNRTGTYTVTWDSSTEGTLHLAETTVTHDLLFILEGFNLITKSDCTPYGEGSLIEIDTWAKVADHSEASP